MNIRLATILMGSLVLVGLLGIYFQKNQINKYQQEYTAKTKQLKKMQKELTVMRAEWSFLTRPEQMEIWAKSRPELISVKPEQLIEKQDIDYIAKFHAYRDGSSIEKLSKDVAKGAVNLEEILSIQTQYQLQQHPTP